MSNRKIRLLLWSGCLAHVILFAGDMLFYGKWGSVSGHHTKEIMANVTLWRLHLGSITAPVGMGFALLAVLGLWHCCRRAAPSLAAVMLASLYTLCLFGLLQHGIFGPLGFALRYCGQSSDAVTQILKLVDITGYAVDPSLAVGFLIWIFLTLRKKAGVPRWTVFLCPLVTTWLQGVMVYVPGPLGIPLAGGWNNIAFIVWYAVLALTYKVELGEGDSI
jgi:hypothetical protein